MEPAKTEEDKIDLSYPIDIDADGIPNKYSETDGRLIFTVMEESPASGPVPTGGNSGEETSIVKPEPLPTRSVILHMPQSLTYGDGVVYSTPELGLMGAGLDTLWTNSKNSGMAGLQKLTRDSLSEFKTGDAKGVALKMLVRMSNNIGGSQIGAAAQQATKYSVNPNFRTQFDHVPVRSFQFDFRMIPRNDREAMAIEAIIKLFRTEVYPERVTPFGDGYSVGYKFPNTFQISGLRGKMGSDLPHGYLPAFLTNVSTSYNAEGRGYHPDGSFLTYDLSLSFQEIRALSKDDIMGGF